MLFIIKIFTIISKNDNDMDFFSKLYLFYLKIVSKERGNIMNKIKLCYQIYIIISFFFFSFFFKKKNKNKPYLYFAYKNISRKVQLANNLTIIIK